MAVSAWRRLWPWLSGLGFAVWVLIWPRPPALPDERPALPVAQMWLRDLSPPPVLDVPAFGQVAVRHPTLDGCHATLLPVDQAPASAQRSATVAWQVAPSSDMACLAWLDEARALVRRHDVAPPAVRPGAELAPPTALERALLACAALVAGWLAALVARSLAASPRRQLGIAAVVFAVALIVRGMWPWRYTAVYFGYEWLAQARHLDSIPRYGPGAQVLWAAVLGPWTEDPRAVLGLQATVGAAACALWSLAAMTMARRRNAAVVQWSGLACGLAMAWTPLLVRNSVSESMHVPALAATAAACWGAARVRLGDSGAAPLAALGITFAALCRADLGPWAALAATTCAWVASPNQGPATGTAGLNAEGTAAGWLRGGWARAWWCVAGLAVALTLVHAALRAKSDVASGNLPQTQELMRWLPLRLGHDAVLWRADWLPMGLWAVVVAWIATGKTASSTAHESNGPHHRWLMLLPVAACGMAASWLDYNETSLPRLQQPAVDLGTLAAAGLLAELAVQHRRSAWLLAAAWLASAVPTLPAVLRKTAAHQEDELIDRAVATLRTSTQQGRPAGWLAVRSYADGDTRGLHLHWPVWRFGRSGGGLRVVPVDAVLAARQQGHWPPSSEPVYLLRSVRCHARPLGVPHRGEWHSCRQLATLPGTEVLWQQTLQPLGDTPTFDWYGSRTPLEVGLYRLPPP